MKMSTIKFLTRETMGHSIKNVFKYLFNNDNNNNTNNNNNDNNNNNNTDITKVWCLLWSNKLSSFEDVNVSLANCLQSQQSCQ